VVLTARPKGVVTAIFPEAAAVGTSVVSVVEVAVETADETPPKVSLLSCLADWKLVPVIVTVVLGAPMVGVKELSVGAGRLEIVKSEALVAVPLGLVTAILPVVAPAGIVTVSWLAVAAETVADVPLNLTVLLAAVVLKPVPKIVIELPTGPAFGVNSEIAIADAAPLRIDVMLPTAS
jgi:hypothetical protein